MERKILFGIEGLDGTGKTTVAKQLASESKVEYTYFLDECKLKPFRQIFDNAPVTVRFIYYLMAAMECDRIVDKKLRNNDVIVDRTIYSTIAYHRAMGIYPHLIRLVPNGMLERYSSVIYLTADNLTRSTRLNHRSAKSEKMNSSDSKSLTLDEKIDKEYRAIGKDKLIEISTNDRTIPQVVASIREALNI